MGNQQAASLNRADIAANLIVEGWADEPTEFATKIAAAVELGHDVAVDCEYQLVDSDGGPRSPKKLIRRYHLSVWSKLNTADLRESLANIEMQRARAAHPSAGGFDRPDALEVVR